MCRSSKIDVLTFEDQYVDLLRLMVDVPTFEDRCWMYRPSKIDVLTFEDRWSMFQPSKIDDQCEIVSLHLLKTLIL